MLDVDEITSILAIDLIGMVLDDDQVIKHSNKGEPIALHSTSKASIAYRNIARRILGETIPLMAIEEPTSVFSKIKKAIRRSLRDLIFQVSFFMFRQTISGN